MILSLSLYIYIYLERERENPQSKKILTDPWNMPWILNRRFMKGILFMFGLLVFEVHSGKLT